MKAAALFLLLISSTSAFLRAPSNNGPVAPSWINHLLQQPRCAFPVGSSHCTNDGLRVTADDVVRTRGGGDDTSPAIVEKSRAFVSKNFFLIGMAVAVSAAKLFPEVSVSTCYEYRLHYIIHQLLLLTLLHVM